MELAKTKVLNKEEKVATDADYMSLFRVLPKDAGLAGALANLEEASKKIILMVGSSQLPEHLEAEYNFSSMLKGAAEARQHGIRGLHCALGRCAHQG